MKTRLISLVSKPLDENKVNFIVVKTLGLKHGPKAEPHTGCCIFRFAVFFGGNSNFSWAIILVGVKSILISMLSTTFDEYNFNFIGVKYIG